MFLSNPAVTELEPYTPGLSREFVSQKYGVALDDVAKLGSAENPLGPSPLAKAAVEAALERIAKRTCDLYLHPSGVAALMGKGGARLRQIQAESGAIVNFLPPNSQAGGASYSGNYRGHSSGGISSSPIGPGTAMTNDASGAMASSPSTTSAKVGERAARAVRTTSWTRP